MTLAPRSRRAARPGPAATTSAGQASTAAPRAHPAVGNRQMQQLLGLNGSNAGKGANGIAGVQPKLAVAASHDPLELEADSIAERVMRPGGAGAGGAPSAPAARGAFGAPSAPSAATQAPPRVQRRASMSPGGATGGRGASSGAAGGPAPASVQRTLSSPGRPLEASVAADMGQRFGQDFSRVRVHTDGAAAASARAINAHAYTAGRDIVFGTGQYQPGTGSGSRLLAHELTHTLQQGGERQAVQRDFSVEPTVADPAAVVLSAAQMRQALRFDRAALSDGAEVAELRDVLGLGSEPAVVDEDLVNAIARYQASYGLTPDGMLGPGTAAQLEREFTTESDMLADPATGTPLRRGARRLHLRSLVTRRTGLLTHQGFVGDDANPEGAVTVRMGDRRDARLDNTISLEYSGENANQVNWLQFVNMRMFATPPGAAAPVFRAGTINTSSGPTAFSDNATTNWSVDAIQPGASPLYNTLGASQRTASRALAMFDQPGGGSVLGLAQAFVAAGAAARATTVTFVASFESYVVRANRVQYHVAWTASTVVNITAGTASDVMYSQGAGGAVTALRGVHRAALLAEYPGNAIR